MHKEIKLITDHKLITKKQLAEMLNVELSWINSMIYRRQIPYLKLVGQIRFCPDQILKWIDEKKLQEESWR